MCGKPKFGSDTVLKPNHLKMWRPFGRFSDINCMQSAIWNKKWTEVGLLALNIQIKNVLKHHRNRVQHVDFRMQLHYLLVVVVVSDVKSHVIHCRCNICCKSITWVVSNYNIRTEPRFLNWTEVFFQKPNRNKKNMFRTSLVWILHCVCIGALCNEYSLSCVDIIYVGHRFVIRYFKQLKTLPLTLVHACTGWPKKLMTFCFEHVVYVRTVLGGLS